MGAALLLSGCASTQPQATTPDDDAAPMIPEMWSPPDGAKKPADTSETRVIPPSPELGATSAPPGPAAPPAGPTQPAKAETAPPAQGGKGNSSKTASKDVGFPSGGPIVNLPAFEMLDSGESQINVQVRGPFQVTEQKASGRIVFFLGGVAVPERVNRLPLLTQHFPTQVTAVTVEQTAVGANVVIDLREPSTSTYKITQNEGGTLLSIVLPPSAKYGATARRTEGAAGSENVTAEEAPDGSEKETARRRKKSRRQPKIYVARPLLLPNRTLAPDVSVAATGYDLGSPNVVLSSGIRWGVSDQFELEATPHAIRLYPNPAFAYPSLGLAAGYTGGAFEIAGRLRYFFGFDSDLADVNAGFLLLGAPMQFHFGEWGRLETGLFVTLNFAETNVRAGLIDSVASPFSNPPGVPVNFLFQLLPELWLGARSGLSIGDFDAPDESFAIPLGAEVGIASTGDFNPIADLILRLDLPELFVPGRSDPIEEKTYTISALFRWYHHL